MWARASSVPSAVSTCRAAWRTSTSSASRTCSKAASTPVRRRASSQGKEHPEGSTAHRGVRVIEGAIETSLQRGLRDTGKDGQGGDVGRGIGGVQHRFPLTLRLGVRRPTRGREYQRQRRGLHLHIRIIQHGDRPLWQRGIAEALESGQGCQTYLGLRSIQIGTHEGHGVLAATVSQRREYRSGHCRGGRGQMLTQRRIGRRTPDTTEQGDSRQAHLLVVTREASADRCHGRRIQVPEVVIVQIQQMDTVFPQQVEERCGIRPVLLMGIDDIDPR